MDMEESSMGLKAFDPPIKKEKKINVDPEETKEVLMDVEEEKKTELSGPQPMKYFIDDTIKESPPCRELTPHQGAMLLGTVSGGSCFTPPYTSDYKGDFYAPAPGLPGEHVGADLDSWVLNHLPHTTSFSINWMDYIPKEMKGKTKEEITRWLQENPEAQPEILERAREAAEGHRKEIEEAILLAFRDQRKVELKTDRKEETKKLQSETYLSKKDKAGDHILKTIHGEQIPTTLYREGVKRKTRRNKKLIK